MQKIKISYLKTLEMFLLPFHQFDKKVHSQFWAYDGRVLFKVVNGAFTWNHSVVCNQTKYANLSLHQGKSFSNAVTWTVAKWEEFISPLEAFGTQPLIFFIDESVRICGSHVSNIHEIKRLDCVLCNTNLSGLYIRGSFQNRPSLIMCLAWI